jgi:prolyl 4-hydroxylase
MQQADARLGEAIALFQAGQEREALGRIQELADAGHADARFTLADCYWRGMGVAQDLVRGRWLFGAAAEVGQQMAVRACTNLLSSGIAGPRDWARALARLEEEAKTDGLRARMLSVIRTMQIDRNGNPLAVPAPEQLSEEPGVWLFRGAFTSAECDLLILLAEPTYERSLVKMDGKDVPDPIRTSDGAAIHWLIEDPATHAINRRLAALTGTAVEQAEPLYILRYRPGQQYHPHVDWLTEPNRRVLTALTYLNDDYAGGETSFVKAGLTVRGRRGDTLVFRNIGRDGNFDPLAEHAGHPVTSGTKYLASRWIREQRHSP